MKIKIFNLTLIFLLVFINACTNYKYKDILKEDYRGVIILKYPDGNIEEEGFLIYNNNECFKLETRYYDELYDYAGVGDSIIKSDSTLFILIRKKDGNYEYFCYC